MESSLSTHKREINTLIQVPKETKRVLKRGEYGRYSPTD
jgi:hypothetical protein